MLKLPSYFSPTNHTGRKHCESQRQQKNKMDEKWSCKLYDLSLCI